MFGDRLVKLRKERKLTQDDVSKKIGVARTSYASYEQNRRVPDSDVQIKLADFFDVSLDYLHGRETERVEIKNKDGYLIAAHAPKDMTPEQIEELERYAEYLIKRDNL
ncbi:MULTISPECIES: helix-turn-helix domain-containing protein [Listeria]|uniref:helix-turn-helix domain-containing protein n=1 Tax=Listeria TaxID=1637 RepID=UPI000B5922A2|nr:MULTISPECIES: helix-turn-helix transcriptional regulator [Listeria]